MKKIILSLIVFFSITNVDATEKDIKSKVKDVTIFLSGAQVNREGSVSISKGQTELIFTGISPLLKRASLQAGSKSDITILSVHYETKKTEKKKPKGNLSELEARKNGLQRKLTRLNSKMEVIKTEEHMITNLQNIQSQKKDFTIDDIIKAKAVISEQLENIKLKKIKTQEEINTINREVNKLSQKITAF